MTPDELRALSDTLRRIVPRPEQDHLDAGDVLERAADYLRQCADAVPVGTLAISTFRGRSEKQNRDFDYTGGLPDGSYSLYTAPMPAAPQAEPIADSDADYWLRHRQAILDAIERAGFVLMSDANRFWLHHKGECDFVEAAAWVYAGWTAAPKAEHAHGITGDSDACR